MPEFPYQLIIDIRLWMSENQELLQKSKNRKGSYFPFIPAGVPFWHWRSKTTQKEM